MEVLVIFMGLTRFLCSLFLLCWVGGNGGVHRQVMDLLVQKACPSWDRQDIPLD